MSEKIFFLTTPILGIMYYFIPKAAERPVYSYRLSVIHFWSLVFVYIWAGPHHLLNTSLPGWLQTLYSLGPLILIFIVFYFFIIGGNRRKEKERAALISSLARGDRVTTIGGIIGNVVDASGDEVVLKVDENNNTKIRITRSAVASVAKGEGR